MLTLQRPDLQARGGRKGAKAIVCARFLPGSSCQNSRTTGDLA